MNRTIRILRNRWQQWRDPQVKIFFIGFNRCGTTTIHHFLKSQGVRSAHFWRDNKNLAVEIEKRVGSPALKEFLDRSTAYSDLCYFTNEISIEGNRHFREFARLFPRAYFVLNDRDLESWIRSRCNKDSKRRGTLLGRGMAYYGADAETVMKIWREQHQQHVAAVLDYFSTSDRFLHFRIDRDPVGKLIEFLSPSFLLDASQWEIKNRTGSKQVGDRWQDSPQF
jgi:hypothetical protein